MARDRILEDGGTRTRGLLVAVAFAAALSLPAAGSAGTFFEFHVERLVGMPTPAGPLLLGSDAAFWELRTPDRTTVWIEARAPDTSPFYLSSTCSGSMVLLPASQQTLLCSRPGTWSVQVDPAGGVAIDITVQFRGVVPFEVVKTRADRGCVLPGVCLP